MSDITIRIADENDASKIIDYLREVTGESIFLGRHITDPLPDLETEKKLLQASDDESFWLMAELAGELVGLLTFERAKRFKCRHWAGFGMSVKKLYWGKNIGSILLAEMLSRAKLLAGLEMIDCEVMTDNDRAIALYKKYGFEEEALISKTYYFEGEYHDEFRMRLVL